MRQWLIVLWLAQTWAAGAVELDVRSSLPLSVVQMALAIGRVPGYLHDSLALLSNPPVPSPDLWRRLHNEDCAGRLRRLAFESSDIESFWQALDEDRQLQDFLKPLIPYAQQKVWTPAQARLQRQARELQRSFESPEAECLIQEALAFYPSFRERSFRVALVPLPPCDKPAAGALAYKDMVLFQVPDRELGLRASGVVFHEIVHLMQMQQDQSEVQGWFDEMGLSQAGLELNEGLATVLGNYLFVKRCQGKAPEGVLYSDPYVEGYARALIPLVEEWLATGQAVNRDFAARAADSYRRAYPQRLSDPAYVVRHMLVAGPDGDLRSELLGPQLSQVGLRSLQESFPWDLGKFQGHSRTLLLFVRPEDLPQLRGQVSEAGIAALQEAKAGVWAECVQQRWLLVHCSSSQDERVTDLRAFFSQPQIQSGLWSKR